MEKFENKLENLIPPLQFDYSITTEVERIKNTLNKLPWYQKHKYNPAFPKNFDTQNTTPESIESCITDEFDENKYKQKEEEVKKIWKEIALEFMKKLRTLGLPVQDNYEIQLTKYGVGGSYRTPKRAIVNFEQGDILIRTIPHEIIHLTIEHLIQEYKINDHMTKERIVDLTHAKFFPENKRLQTDPEKHSKEIGEIFEKYFPDIKKVIIEIHELEKQQSHGTTT